MFNENLKIIRKEKGLSQEQMALRLNVVRQTISKWEKGLSIPDAEMTIKIAEILDVSVNKLLDEKIETEEKEKLLENITSELEKLNEFFATKQQKSKQIKKKILDIIIIVFAIVFVCAIYGSWNNMFYEFGKHLYNWFN